MEVVRDLRKAMSLTQVEFAARLGVTPTTAYRWESVRPPRGAMLKALAALAENSGMPEIAASLLPGSRESSTRNRSTTGANKNQQWHDLLDLILNEGSERDQTSIQQNLKWAAEAVRRSGAEIRKRTG